MANIKDGATGTVLTAPSPQSSGVTLVLNSGEGARFPAPPFWAVAGPNNGLPLVSVAEKILVTAVVGDTFTIVRAPFGPYTAKNIDVGWRISNAIFQDDFNNASIVKNEVPAGAVNGVNSTYTIASPAHTTGSLEVYKNGIRLKGGGEDYTETATGFSMTTAPATGTRFLVDYIVTGAINNVGTNSLITDETPAGTVNGSTVLFTAARAYIPGSLELHINGLKQKRVIHFTETNPSLGTFTISDAPLTGDDVMINYAFNLNPSGNTDTVDGLNASTTPTPGMLVPLTSNSRFPGNTVAKLLLDHIANTDLLNATNIAANTWTDVQANMNFTVSSSDSLIIIDFRGQMQLGENNSGNSVSRIVVDSGSTPIPRRLGGMNIMGIAGAFYANPFAGGGPIIITGLAAGVHTLKPQVFVTTANKMYLRAGTRQDEFLEMQVMEIGG